ncbi:uncharacterized protein LOC129767398 [Toxorhynchites rutilus septentrionalis]|uniref:uncharacterized protein LOC129767398 n=1 Tax=Toxorhynchites rutilus septentrionalis TaxID=329112 RepID=UPI00247B1E42|nr:uncharacterized protein LOC129767398 [Toxorhynchites rutilus septentrionalis]
MDGQGDSIQTFSDLRLAHDRLNQIPMTKISQLSLDSLRRQDSDVEVYEYMFTEVLHFFDPDEFEKTVSEVLLPELLKHLKKIATELKDNALSCFLTDNLRSLLTFARLLSKFAEYVVGSSKTYQLYKTVTVFLEFLVHSYEVIRDKITVIQQKTPEYDILKHIYTICQSIQLSMTNLLASSEEPARYFQHTDVEDEYSCLKDVISMFCKIGLVTTTVDLKLSTEAWKAVVKLISRHAKQIENKGTVWLHNHISAINMEIDTFSHLLLQHKSFTKNDMVKLKLKSLLLKVLLRLMPLIDVDEFDGHGEILNAVVAIECTLSLKELDENSKLSIRQYLKAGYMSLIGLLFNSSKFAKAFVSLQYQSIEEMAGFFEIVMHVISKLITDDRDSHIIEKYTNLLQTCIHNISRSHHLFIERHDIYRRLLVHLSAFVIICRKCPSQKRQKQLEENLVGMILTDSYWVGIMGLDIWSVYLRYHSVDLLWEYFKFWKLINDKFSAFPSRLRAVFVRRLLRNIYIFAPRNIQRKAWTEYSVLKKENYRLWAAVKLKTVDNEIADIANEELKERVQKNLPNIGSMESFFNLLHEILLINSRECRSHPQKFESALLGLWKSFAMLNVDAVNSSSIVCTLIDISACPIQNSSSQHSEFSKILTDTLSDRIHSLSLVSKHHLLNLIDGVLPSDEGKKLLQLLTDENDMVLRGIATYMLKKSKGLKKQTNLSSSVVRPASWDRTKCQSIVHHCYSTKVKIAVDQHINDKIDELFPDDHFLLKGSLGDDEDMYAAKRPKLDHGNESNYSKMSESIEIINQQVKVLQEISRENSMHINQLDKIRSICAMLNAFTHPVDL